MQGAHKTRTPTGKQALEAWMVSRAEEEGVGLWDFQGKEDHSQEDEKE